MHIIPLIFYNACEMIYKYLFYLNSHLTYEPEIPDDDFNVQSGKKKTPTAEKWLIEASI